MCRAIILLASCVLGINMYAQTTDIVRRYCDNLASWASDKNITYLHAMEDLRSTSPAFRIGNKLMDQLADKNGLTKTDTYDWDVYIPCIQKEIDRGIRISFSDIKTVPKEYIEQKYPGVEYVSCNVSIKGSLSTVLKDLFILKGGKIAKIADYVETIDVTTGKKKVEVDYLALAHSAFADRDYSRCYSLYKEGGLKSISRQIKDHPVSASDIFPFVESCVALGKWDEAMHGLTDNHIVTNRKTWVNGVEWKLNPEDLESWNKNKDPLMDHLLKKTYSFYRFNPETLKDSPIINHVSRCRGIQIDKIIKNAAFYFWNERTIWNNIVPIRAAAELGHFDAQKHLGKYYLTGRNQDPVSRDINVIPCDTLKSVRWFEVAAAQGDVESANIAAHLYLSGHGVPQDFSKAYALYRNNATKNDYDSQYGLGICYYYGHGVQRDLQAALPLLKETEDWHADVPFLIGNIYYMDNYNPEALKYYDRALKRRNLNQSVRRSILTTLSDCHRYGRCGLAVDTAEADRLLQEAQKTGDVPDGDLNDHFISLTQIHLTHDAD